MKVDIHKVSDRYKKYAVIITYESGKLVLVRHKERATWEIPGGTNEEGEKILYTAKRELYEETGATKFEIKHIYDYSVERKGEINYGGLFIANILAREEELKYEIEEIKLCSELPSKEELTYGIIQKELFDMVGKELKKEVLKFQK